MNTKNNQRYRDMDICMKAALLELMQKMPFEKITVKAICERAGVNRGTFYSHYSDIDGILADLEDYMSGELLLKVESWVADRGKDTVFLPYLVYIREHQYAYRIILASRKVFSVRKSFEPLFTHLVLPHCRLAEITDAEQIDYYQLAFQSAVITILEKWIETGCTKDEKLMNRILMDCVPTPSTYISDRGCGGMHSGSL